MQALQRWGGAMGVAMLASATPAIAAPAAAEAKSMELVAHHELGGNGDGGEGMAIQQRPDGRRILYLAHEGQKTCLSVVDVTDPKAPSLLNQLPSPGSGVARCNSLGLAGDVLAVANQTLKPGQKPAGMWLLDVADLSRVQHAQALGDLSLAFFDTSGAHSRGVHWLWFVDGEFAHLATGAGDFSPTNVQDDQFYMVVDVRDRRNPREVGRWWLPGTRVGDACLPQCLPKRQAIDDGYRAHDIHVYPQRSDRAYVGYIDAGAVTFDVSGLSEGARLHLMGAPIKTYAHPLSIGPAAARQGPKAAAPAWKQAREAASGSPACPASHGRSRASGWCAARSARRGRNRVRRKRDDSRGLRVE